MIISFTLYYYYYWNACMVDKINVTMILSSLLLATENVNTLK